MIFLDTNFLIMALHGETQQERQLEALLASRSPLNISSIAWTEFLCGPVPAHHLTLAQRLFPSPAPYLPEDAVVAAELYNSSGRRRGSILDCMIAAVCVRRNATLATSDVADFQRFAAWGLRLLTP